MNSRGDERRRRRLRRRWIGGLVLVLSLIVAFVPVERYRPACWIHLDRLGFEGRMREDYIAWLTDGLRDEGFAHLRFGDDVFLRLIYPWHWIDPGPHFDTLGNFLLNMEWRYVNSIVSGLRVDGTKGDPPEVLRGLSKRLAESSQSEASAYTDCEVMRAAMIRVEDLRREQRRRVVPKNPRPDGCYINHVDDPDNFDPRCGDVTDSVVGGRYLP